jgi:hypothetical protein
MTDVAEVSPRWGSRFFLLIHPHGFACARLRVG